MVCSVKPALKTYMNLLESSEELANRYLNIKLKSETRHMLLAKKYASDFFSKGKAQMASVFFLDHDRSRARVEKLLNLTSILT